MRRAVYRGRRKGETRPSLRCYAYLHVRRTLCWLLFFSSSSSTFCLFCPRVRLFYSLRVWYIEATAKEKETGFFTRWLAVLFLFGTRSASVLWPCSLHAGCARVLGLVLRAVKIGDCTVFGVCWVSLAR